ncbi:MAG: endopeptidase La [Clostridia bacterium]|nr:endopeptidase La [Clostridia bacterium]
MAVHLIYKSLPTVALRGVVVFPGMRLHFEIARDKSIRAIQTAVSDGQKVFLVTQRSVAVEDPDRADLFEMGVIATIKQVVHSPDSKGARVIVEGISRAVITDFIKGNAYLVSDVKERRSTSIRSANADYVDALIRKTKAIFEEYIELTEKKAPDVALEVYLSQDPGHLADFIAGNALSNFEDRQRVLEELNPIKRLELLCAILSHEMTIYRIEDQIDQKVQDAMDQNQHEYYLREQLKVISDELGDTDDGVGEAQAYRERILSLSLPEPIEKKLLKEAVRLGKMQSTSPDANVIRTYLDACLDLPWNQYTEDKLDLDRAREVLDRDHYGMEKIKERFLEMLAVRALTDKTRAQIICLVGPPGVGKTSIVRSVAEAMGRKYVRMSLGGVRDEAEIRGHRKTYIGAMPGRIAAALTQAGSMNPIMLLDEVDKLGADYKGDPSAALLEALDPEQNNTFRDHFLEFPLDLSRVLFITTANDAATIPAPLYDRMEVIELPSYTAQEKFMIAKEHLIQKQLALHGLTAAKLRIRDDVIKTLIAGYTREAGVRRLEQLLASVCRKGAVRLAKSGKRSLTVNVPLLEEMLGPPKYKEELPMKTDLVGVVNGLAWTSVGGELLQVEAVTMDGTGKLELTGSLGDVMKESAKTALSFVRSVAARYKIDPRVFKERDIHIHVPQGAVPKDGPSAGVTMATALLSALTGRAVRRDLAMTGEISLTGRVLAIGGLKEKTIAAYRSGIKVVLIPQENESDLWEVDPVVKENVEFLPVDRLEDVFRAALLPEQVAKKGEALPPVVPAPGQPNRKSIAQ